MTGPALVSDCREWVLAVAHPFRGGHRHRRLWSSSPSSWLAFDRFRKWKRPPAANQGAVSPAGSGLVVPGSQVSSRAPGSSLLVPADRAGSGTESYDSVAVQSSTTVTDE